MASTKACTPLKDSQRFLLSDAKSFFSSFTLPQQTNSASTEASDKVLESQHPKIADEYLHPEQSFKRIFDMVGRSSDDPHMSDKLSSLHALLASTETDSDLEVDTDDDDLSLEEIMKILDEKHIIKDLVTYEGKYGDFIDPFSFATSNNPDVLTRSKMLKSKDSLDFLKSEFPEIRGLEEADVFDYKHISTLPRDSDVRLLNSIWSYRRKRRPDGTLLKHKARICVDGSRQRDGIDYYADETN